LDIEIGDGFVPLLNETELSDE